MVLFHGNGITLAFGGAALGLQASLTVLSKLDMVAQTRGYTEQGSNYQLRESLERRNVGTSPRMISRVTGVIRHLI